MADIDGSDRSEWLFDKNEDDIIRGFGGNDRISVTFGRDFVDGGADIDHLVVNWSTATTSITFFGISGTYGWVDTGGDGGYGDSTRRVDYQGIERLTLKGGSGNDTLQGIANSDDIILGGGGVDLWVDSFSADTSGRTVVLRNTRSGLEHANLTFGAGDDLFRDHQGRHDDTIRGGDGDDRAMLVGGRDFFNGGAGFDTLTLEWSGETRDATVYNISGTYAWVNTGGKGGYADSTRRVDFQSVESIRVTTGSGNDYIEGVANQVDTVLMGGGRDTYRDSFTAATSGVFANVGYVNMGTQRLGTIQGAERFIYDLSDFDDEFRDVSGRHSSAYSKTFLQNLQGQFDDVIRAHDGDDIALFHRGRDFFDGGAGDDLLHVRWNDVQGDITFFASSGTYGWVNTGGDGSYAQSNRRIDYQGVERLKIQAGSGDDYIQGINNAADFLQGNGGVDTVKDSFSETTQAIKIDLFKGGARLPDGSYFWGFEQVDLTLGLGNDKFSDWGAYDDVVRGYDGNDKFTIHDGRDFIDGGKGTDLLVIDWSSAKKPVTVFATSGTYGWAGKSYASATQRVDYQGIERLDVTSGKGDDTLQGAGLKDVLNGGGGDDSIKGYGGNDKINGGAGDDALDGGDGNDKLLGGLGLDTLAGGDGNDRLDGGGDNDVLLGDQGADVLKGGSGVDLADYSASAAAVTVDLRNGTGQGGDAAGDRLVKIEDILGSKYADVLIGDGAANDLDGGAGDDRLEGGGGKDNLSGGAGSNTYLGGAGGDVFVIATTSGVDTIEDFDVTARGEVIDLTAFSAITDFKDLKQNHLSKTNGDATIVSGSKSIVLVGVDASDLGANDFLFG